MGLQSECLEYIGGLLYVHPGYGWGWCIQRNPVQNPRKDTGHIDFDLVKDPFHIKLLRINPIREELRDLVGIVEEPGHLFHGFWILCTAMHVGEFDLKNQPCLRYNLEIGKKEEQERDNWAQSVLGGLVLGYGMVMESRESWVSWNSSLLRSQNYYRGKK